MFKIKKLNISITTGGYRVMLNHEDADILGLKKSLFSVICTLENAQG